MSHQVAGLLDFRFTERDVLAGDGVILAHFHLAGLGACVLFRDVEVASIRRGNELDLNGVGLCHDILSTAPPLLEHSGAAVVQVWRKMRIQKAQVKLLVLIFAFKILLTGKKRSLACHVERFRGP